MNNPTLQQLLNQQAELSKKIADAYAGGKTDSHKEFFEEIKKRKEGRVKKLEAFGQAIGDMKRKDVEQVLTAAGYERGFLSGDKNESRWGRKSDGTRIHVKNGSFSAFNKDGECTVKNLGTADLKIFLNKKR